MKNTLILVLTCFVFINARVAYGQYDEQSTIEWINNLYEHGVKMTDDSIYINDEVKELLTNKSYRTKVHNNQQDWSMTMSYIQNNEVKKACWNLINLFALNDYSKDKVVKILLTYDQMFKMEEVLISSFYTYCYTDPEIGAIIDGKPIVHAPHIMEQKLYAVKEIIYYMERYKTSKTD